MFDAFSRTHENPPANAVVLPLLMKASVHFTNRLHVLKAFGDDAMPREFYRVYDSHHLDIWTSTSLAYLHSIYQFAR
jgi:hypothetical protein